MLKESRIVCILFKAYTVLILKFYKNMTIKFFLGVKILRGTAQVQAKFSLDVIAQILKTTDTT